MNKQVKSLVSNDIEWNKIEFYGKVVANPTIGDLLKKIPFKRKTMEGSFYSNEFRIINNKLGFHHSPSGPRLCEYELKDVIMQEKTFLTDEKTEKQVVTKTNEPLTEETLKKLLLSEGFVNQEELTQIEQEILEQAKKQSGPYIEMKATNEEVSFYLEFDDNIINLRINQYRPDDKNFIYLNGNEFSGKDLAKVMEDEIVKATFDLVNKGVQKLENGYLYQNKYYECLEDVKDKIEKL